MAYATINHPRSTFVPSIGDTVMVQGHEFTVAAVRIIDEPDGSRLLRFVGRCTDNPINDSIRNTAYNGGTYGWSLAPLS